MKIYDFLVSIVFVLILLTTSVFITDKNYNLINYVSNSNSN